MRGFKAPRFSCIICHKQFKSKTKHYRHVINSSCNTKKEVQPGRGKTIVEIQDPEQQTTQYFGREYTNNPIPTGNRHYRAGVYSNVRLSKYRSAAI